MNQGLHQLLQHIETDPDNQLFQDRFMSLIRDFSDDQEKADSLLSLSSVLVGSHPRRALQYAFMVHRWDRHLVSALELMAESLERLGQQQKVEVIRKKIEKLDGRSPLDEDAATAAAAVADFFQDVEPNQSWFEDVSGSYLKSPSVAIWNEPLRQNQGVQKETIKLDLTLAMPDGVEFDQHSKFFTEIEEAMNRGQLRWAYQALGDQLVRYPELPLAEKIWELVPDLMDRMSVEAFTWSADDGVHGLRDRLQRPLSPKSH